MRKIYHVFTCCFLAAALFSACKSENKTNEQLTEQREEQEENEENEGYDGPLERGMLETEKTKDPALGYVPVDRLWSAIEYTEQLKQSNNYRTLDVLWTERGPIFDSVGPSNGNGRAGVNYTAGRVAGVLVDAGDPSGNTVFVGGIAGGLWKCTNFLDVIPNWVNIQEYFDNLAISSICQSPVNPDIIYVSTGEATDNADAVYGRGVYKTTNHGLTWSPITSTIGFNRNFKIACDASGNVYLATRGFGLRRSTDEGATWTDITPTGLTATNPTFCTDIEITSTGKLHAVFGYNRLLTGGVVNYRYTNTPTTVTSSTGWNTGTGIRTNTTVPANRMEIAAVADTLYAVTTNAVSATNLNNVDSCYMSRDGGATWVLRNTTAYTTNVTNTQGWYDLSLAINPDSTSQIIVAGLDAYKSKDSGRTVTRNTFWVTTAPYVHADHHFIQWWKAGEENRVLMGTDGGLFLSRDTGKTYRDKNRNLAIKQFYGVAQHPTDPSYLIAGAQDNGTHQLKYPGLGPSVEVTGGDGCLVHINQKNPLIQFASYVYNQYRRSTNGGATWTSINPSTTRGMFVNPFTYDDDNNILYACFSSTRFVGDSILRWNNANTTTNAASRDTLSVSKLRRATDTAAPAASAFKVSPYTPGRLYVGSNSGGLVRIDSANTVTNATINGKTTIIANNAFPRGFLNCIAVGTSDDYLLAIFTNYGINNVWYSENGGTSWTAIDGNLPDMPVRWAVFHPTDNTKIILATEAGIYTTLKVNGALTQWAPSPGFPPVRTDQIVWRASDNTIAVATHGRGIFTGNILAVLPLRNITLSGSLAPDGNALLNWKAVGATNNSHYRLQYSTDGISFTEIANLPYSVLQYKHALSASVGYYRVMGTESNQAPVFSNTVEIKSGKPFSGLQVRIIPNPVTTATGSFLVSSSVGGAYSWMLSDLQGRTLQTGKGTLPQGGSQSQQLNTANLPAAIYKLKVIQNKQVVVSSILKQ